MIFGDHGSEEPSSSVKVDAWLNPRLETAAAVMGALEKGGPTTGYRSVDFFSWHDCFSIVALFFCE